MTKLLYFSIQRAKYCTSTMANPLIAVCQMRSIADKVKNLEVVTELAAEAKHRSAVVCIFVNEYNIKYFALCDDFFQVLKNIKYL